MGVPKFYRWISERYPCLSEVLKEHEIPDFDNLYLDMNGIIHTCSHPNDDDPHFRITEEKIFSGICYYIDFLFKMIKPKKVFFMAVDGVAPRAKMNQQRGRRFRTAKAAVILEERAKQFGENLPTEARFDSNCITPGTVFMARLHEKLKGFVVHKISTDALWQSVRVYLSGHETPGEGEHKIMDFIRHEKSQSGYDPNTRHCLYGLDADLIMLGLCSHEPHFSLLREEVKFGGKRNQKRILTPEETTFHLLHISLLREYLDYEFQSVKEKIKFEYNIEHIIDDFVLMSFLVGNDFIPNLPQLHIQHDALPMLYQKYIEVLPSLGGYINESGHLNLEHFEIFLAKLAEYDFEKFGVDNEDFEYLDRKCNASHNVDEIDKINTSNILSNLGFSNLAISKMAEYDSSTEDEGDDVETDGEESTLELAFTNHKNCYYLNKLEYDTITPEVMKEQAEGYVRAIQWNLHYYYNGVISWSWYYPHHYAPFMSDLKDFKDMEMKFERGKPFLPFQQLLAVLPKLSKELLPLSYQELMCDEDSPLIDYYPDEFETDLNGKQQEWEAVVLIPFINEKLLLKFAYEADKKLNVEEKKRNQHGPHLLYTRSDKPLDGPIPSFLVGYFPDIKTSYAKLQELPIDYFRLLPEKIMKGLCEGVILDKFFMGFPTLKTIKHTAKLKNEKVKVFQMASQKDNMMLYIKEIVSKDIKAVAREIVGKIIYVGWPHLRQAFVVSVSDGDTKCLITSSSSGQLKLKEENMDKNEKSIWAMQVSSVEEHCYQRWGIFIDEVKILVHVKCLAGSRYVLSKSQQITEEKQWEKTISNYALQTTLSNIDLHYSTVKIKGVKELFTPGLVVFLIGESNYGCMGTIENNDVEKHNGKLLVKLEISVEPDLKDIVRNQNKFLSQEFMPVYIVAQHVGIKCRFISRITGTFLIQTSSKESMNPNRVNIGLNLKFNKRNEEVCGFSKKTKDDVWLYSDEAVKILQQYLSQFAYFFEKLIPFQEENIVYLEDIYPDGSGNDIINKISDWLKGQACSSAERQKCGMEKLDAGIIAAIEQKVHNSIKQNKICLKTEVSPQNLYCPFLSKGALIPDPSTTFQLFDRVINVSPSSSVPLGLRGTIIGIKSAEKESEFMYEVLFDEEFFGGLHINCSSKKGYRMSPSALINISHGERIHSGNESPQKRLKDPPKLSKCNLFSSAIKDIKTVKTPENSQIRVLQKNSDFNTTQAGQPFYKANVDTPQHSSDPFSSLFASNLNNSNKQFVTPKASTRSSGSNFTPPSLSSSSRTTPNQIAVKDYHNLWDDLKKNSSPESSPTKSKKPVHHNYGVQVSVQELFKGAESHKQQLPTVPQLPQSQAQSSVATLISYYMHHYGGVPLYSYDNYGPTGLRIAKIHLPNGTSFTSGPYSTDKDAAEDAASKALVFINSKGPPPPITYEQQTFGNSIAVQRPIVRSRFLADHARPAFPNPLCLQNPPVFNSPHPMYNVQLARHPYPMPSQTIPDSFVQKTNLILQNEMLPFSDRYQIDAKRPIENKTQISDANVFHMPGPMGGTASVRNKTKVPTKGYETQNLNMFVPSQVQKKAVKANENVSNPSTNDWPLLPPSKDQLPEVSPPVTKEGNMPKTEISESASFSSKVKSTIQNSISVSEKTVPSPTTPVQLKPKKKRIAANFSNMQKM